MMQLAGARIARFVEQRSTVIAVVLLVGHATVAWLARQPGVLLGHNDAMYVALGESLRTFGYREVWYADMPPHAMYPPLYPAVLAVLEAIHGTGFHWLVWGNVLASTAALALLFAAVRTWQGPVSAVVCLAALAVNPSLILFAGSLAAETQLILAIALVVYALAHEDRGRHMSVLAGGAALAAALLRTAAVPLVVAVALQWALQRRFRRAAIYSVVSVLLVGSWLLWSAAVPNQAPGRSYVADAMLVSSHPSVLVTLARRISPHVSRYASILYWDLPMPTIRSSQIDNLIGFPLALTAIVVGLMALVRKASAIGLFLVMYGALLAVWPYIEDRFFVPVIPVMVICAVIGSLRLMQRRSLMLTAVGGSVLAMMLITGGSAAMAAAGRRLACHRTGFFPDPSCVTEEERGFLEAMRYIRDNTPPDAVFLSSKPATLYYYTGRRSIIRELAVTRRPGEFLALLKARHARYLLLGRSDFMEVRRFAPRIRDACGALELERRIERGMYLFRVPEEDAPRDNRACEAMEEYYSAVQTAGDAHS